MFGSNNFPDSISIATLFSLILRIRQEIVRNNRIINRMSRRRPNGNVELEDKPSVSSIIKKSLTTDSTWDDKVIPCI